MKTLNLYILVLATLVNSIVSFSCDNYHLEKKKTLAKATELKVIEEKHMYTGGTEYITWYIDPCHDIEKKPEEGKNDKERCPKNSRVCKVRSIELNDEKKRVLDVKGFAVGEPPNDPFFRNENEFHLNFEGEDGSNTSAEIIFNCAGNEKDAEKDPEIEYDEEKKKVTIKYKGMCVTDGKTSPTDDDKDKDDDDKKKGSSHFFIRFILIIIICYFGIGMCYNFFVLNKTGLDIIPNVDLWINIFGSISDKISEMFGRRNYQPLLS